MQGTSLVGGVSARVPFRAVTQVNLMTGGGIVDTHWTSNSEEQLEPEGLGRQPWWSPLRAEAWGEEHLTGAMAFGGGRNSTWPRRKGARDRSPAFLLPPSKYLLLLG